MLQLYYFPDNASLAPHLLLAETQVDYSLRLVDRNSNAQKSKEYLKLNPAGRIPTLGSVDTYLSQRTMAAMVMTAR
jgi:glutathione S-transferase